MLDINIAYPEFVPNQILTDRQLNQLRTHLEQEDRITRLRLAGMGIVCGLHARKVSTPANAVEIDAGYGVTSDGDLIELCDHTRTTYTHFRAYADPDRDEENKVKYVLWRSAADTTQMLDIVELIQKEAMEVSDAEDRPQGATAFTAAHLDPSNVSSKVAGRVLVLYLEHQPVELNSCLVTSCDNKGRNINVHVRALLVKKSDLTSAAGSRPFPVFHRVPRLHTRHALQPGSTDAQITTAFREIVTGQAAPVGASIKTLFDTYAPFLNLQTLAAGNPLPTTLTDTTHVAQYQYDALLDFVSAYTEAAAGAFALVKECCPASTFPRHLMLGVLDASTEAGFRNEFSPSPLRNVMHGEIDRVRGLFRRLNAMIGAFNLEAPPSVVSIRPSHTAAYPLGRRAARFYFTSPAMELWFRPKAGGTIEADWPWMHPPVLTGLNTDYAENTFLRIEGHIGRDCQAAYEDVVEQRRQGNAEFHLLSSYLDDGGNEERQAREQLAELLNIAPEASRPAWMAFAGWIGTGDQAFDPVVQLATTRAKQLEDLQEASTKWIGLRERRRLHCDTAALAHDYLQARGDLLCLISRASGIVQRFMTDIVRLPDEQLTGPGLERMREGAPFVLVDHLVAAVLATPADWSTDDAIKGHLGSTGNVEPAGALRAALDFGLRNLNTNLQQLAALALPRRVAEFDFDLFAYFFRTLLAQSRELWIWARALGLQIPGATSQAEGPSDAPLHRAEDAPVAADWLGLQGCVLARFATISAEYEAIRAHDFSSVRNLAEIDGVEHLAGVSKGGTFVLLCDKVSSDGRVLADFSLEGCLPCCCDFDAEGFCLPPLALPDVRVVTVSPRDGTTESHVRLDIAAPIKLDINVIANDCDLNGVPQPMRIAELSQTSDLGGELHVNPEGIIGYTAPKFARPGMVDRFNYQLLLTSKECQGRTTVGTVIVVFAVEPVVDGRIHGIVVHGDTGEHGDDAIVTIGETGSELMTSGSGEFTIDPIAAGEYTLVAVQDGSTSDPTRVLVTSGETTEVELRLKKAGGPAPVPRGTIVVRVRDVTGAALPGVTVIVTNEIDPTRTGVTDNKGIAHFVSLPVGNYRATALLAGTVAEQVSGRLDDGQTLVLEVVLGSARVTIPSATLDIVATRGRVNVLEANARVRETVDDRYAKYANTFNRATDDPTILASDARATAAAFLGRQLTDPAATDASLAAGYKATATALATAASQATGDEKAPYQQALAAVTAAYLDHVALASPDTLSAARTTEIRAAVKTLKTAGVAVADVQSMWDGNALGERTGIGSTGAIAGLLV